MVVMPRSTRICAPMPYSRLSTGRPSSRLASTVSRRVLQGVGAELVREADAATLVAAQVDDAPSPSSAIRCTRRDELRSAVTAQRAEHVAGEALGVHAHEHVLLALHRATHEREVLLTVEQALVDVAGEVAPLGGDLRLGDATHELLALAAIADQVGDRDELQVVLARELDQLGQTGHAGLVRGDDLAQDARPGRDRPCGPGRPLPRCGRPA